MSRQLYVGYDNQAHVRLRELGENINRTGNKDEGTEMGNTFILVAERMREMQTELYDIREYCQKLIRSGDY